MSDIHRRHFLRSTAAVAAVAATTLIPAGRAVARTAPSCGCCGRGHVFGLSSLGDTSGISGFATSSGDPTTDRFLGRALLRLATTFDVQPGFLFCDDFDSPNAAAEPTSLLPGTEGTVLMGKRFFSEHMQLGDNGVTMIAVCAHEFGHIRQMKSGLINVLGPLDKTVRPIELHADFLAGAFLGLRKREYPNIDLQAAGETFVALGDNNLSSPSHHGTAEERIAAVTAGYDIVHSGVEGIDQITKAGVAFVRRVV